MSKFKSGVSGGRKTSRRPTVPEEQTAHCSTSHFQPDGTFGDCDETSRFLPGSMAGMSPSSRGRTMKECEEQLSQLHKENFNLKLRIYFLEERLGHRGPAAPPGSEAAECEATLRAEVESLRVELVDKQRLLCQAASAIDLVEGRHRQEVERLGAAAAAERAKLERRLEQMQKMYVERCKQLEDEVTRVSSLPGGGQPPVETATVSTQCAVDPADAAERVNELSRQLEARGRQVAEAEQRIKGLEEALCEKQPEIQIKIQELRERDNIIEEKQNQIEQQNRVLVEIQITLAEKQRLIDALNATIAARDVSVARLEAELEAARGRLAEETRELGAARGRLTEETRELGRARGENEMLKTQLARRTANRGGGGGRESPRRRGANGGGRSRDSVSPRNKSLIEEAIEGIWSSPVLRTRDEFLPFEEKENVWKPNDSKEKPDRQQQLVDYEKKTSDRFSEENYLKLEKEHQRGCEAIQGFIARIKHLANENESVRRESKRTEKKLSETRMELKELRDSYNKAKWEARQLQADATGVPGTLADVRDMTEEENERLWAEVEDKNKKLAQLSLEMEKQIQALLTSLKEKEAKLAASENDLASRDKYVRELEGKLSQLGLDLRTSKNATTNNPTTFNVHDRLSKDVGDEAEVDLKQSLLGLQDTANERLWNKNNLQDIVFENREMEIFSLRHQVEFKDLQLKLFADKTVAAPANGCVPVSFVQHLHLQQMDRRDIGAELSLLGVQPAKERQQQPLADSDGLERAGDGPAVRPECDRLRDDLRQSEVALRNATNACGLLAGRLEELAGFLVSLLRRPDRMGRLDTTHCRFIRQAVARSVDVSRQLSASVSRPEVADSSLSLVGRYLDGTASIEEAAAEPPEGEEETTTLEGCARVIGRLRSRVDALGLEIRQRDIELDCLVQEHALIRLSSPLFEATFKDRTIPSMLFHRRAGDSTDCRPAEGLADTMEMFGVDDSTDHARLPEPGLVPHAVGASRHNRGGANLQREAPALSESETWSEPDRQISLARIGLRADEDTTPASSAPPFRHHHSRTLRDPEDSSGSSQETAREIVNRSTPGKQRRGGGEGLESRRLHARLRGLEQVNEALRIELAIVRQVTPVSSPDPIGPSDDNEIARVVGDSPHLAPGLAGVDNPVVIPSHLLEQIRRQREKLESSLFHNDFIRRQLEGVFLSATGQSEGFKLEEERAALMAIEGETMRAIEAKLRVAEDKVLELEEKLREAERLLAESGEQAIRLAEAERRRDEAIEALLALQNTAGELEALVLEREAEVVAMGGLVAELEERLSKQRAEIAEQEERTTKQREEMVELEERATKQKAEIEKMVQEMSELRAESERRVAEAEGRLREAKEVLSSKVEGIEREVRSFERRNRETETELKDAKGRMNEALMQRAEAEKVIEAMKVEFAAKVSSFEETRQSLELRIELSEEEGNRESERRSRQLEEAERQLEELRSEVGRKVKLAESRAEAAEGRLLDARRERDESAIAASRAALEGTRRANERLRLEQELRVVEAELSRERLDAEGRMAALQRREADLEARARELEGLNVELRVRLERAAATRGVGATSPPPPHHRHESGGGYASGRGVWTPDNRPRSPDSGRSPLSSLVLQRGFGRQHSEFSDYVSEDQEYETVVTRSCSSSYWITTVTGSGARNAHSPDLGIESDQGRFSSLEANPPDYPERRRPEAALDETTSSAVQTFRRGRSNHNCAAIEQTNYELKRELCQTRRALEDTLAQLTASNHRKQDVEKAICKQIEKTCTLLQETRENLQPEHLMLCNDRT